MVNTTRFDQLVKIVNGLTTNDILGTGVRPYGFHIGNMTPLATLAAACLASRKNGNNPAFLLHVFLNDNEPHYYVGANGQRDSADAANMFHPRHVPTIQFLPGPEGFSGSAVDYWAPLYLAIAKHLFRDHPGVKISIHRCSEVLVPTDAFTSVAISALRDVAEIKGAYFWHRPGMVTSDQPFALPIFPGYTSPVMRAKIIPPNPKTFGLLRKYDRRNLGVEARIDGQVVALRFDQVDWSVRFDLLQAARLAAYVQGGGVFGSKESSLRLWLLGMDHLQVSVSGLREALAETLGVEPPKNDFHHTPLVFEDGQKLSKSTGARDVMPLDDLVAVVSGGNPGVNVHNAFKSPDLLVLGASLPAHMLAGFEERQVRLARELEAYRVSGDLESFKRDNRPGMVREGQVARLLGVPHL